MARYFLPVVLLLGCSVALSQTDLINDDLNSAPPGAWTKVGGGPNVRLDSDHGGGGDWAVGGSDGSGSSAAYDNYYHQTFAAGSLPSGAGVYDINLEGWTKSWAGWWSGENWSWVQEAHLELWIDGALVFSGYTSDDTGTHGPCGPGPWDTWVQQTYSGTHAINTDIQVRLRAVKDNDNCSTGGLGAIYYDSRFDDVLLQVTEAPPEPSPTPLAGVEWWQVLE